MDEDKIREFEGKFINKEITRLDVISEFEKEDIGFCYEASKIAEDEDFNALLLDIEDKKIKSWLDNVRKKRIDTEDNLSDIINGKSRSKYISDEHYEKDNSLRISQVNFYRREIEYRDKDIDRFYAMLLERYCSSTILCEEPYKSILTAILKNYQLMLFYKSKKDKNDRTLKELLKTGNKGIYGNNRKKETNKKTPKDIDEMLEILRLLNKTRLQGGYYFNINRDLNGKPINEESIPDFEDFSQSVLIYSIWLEQIRKNYSREDKKIQECQEIIKACSKFLKIIEPYISKYRKTRINESKSLE